MTFNARQVDIAAMRVVVNADTSEAERGLTAFSGRMSSLLDAAKFGAAFEAGFQLVKAGIDGLVGGFEDLANAAIGLNDKLTQSTNALTVLTGSADNATESIAGLEALSTRATSLSLPQLIIGDQRLQATGLSAQNAQTMLVAVANAGAAVGASSERMQAVIVALDQINARGVVLSQQLRIMTSAGIPVYKLLADQMGITEVQLTKLIRTGQISAAQFDEMFAKFAGPGGQIGDLMALQATTFQGAMNVIRNNMQLAVADAFQPFYEAVRQAAAGIATFVRSDDFVTWIGIVKGMVTEAVSSFRELVQGLAPVGDAIAKAFHFSAQGDMSSAAAAIVAPFKAAFEEIRSTINGFTGGMFDAGVNVVTTFASGIYQASESIIGGAVNSVASVIASFLIGHSPPEQGPLSDIQNGGRRVMEAYINGFLEGLPGVQQLAQQVEDALEQVNQRMTLSEGRSALEAAAGNLKALQQVAAAVKLELSDLNDTMANLNAQIGAVQIQINSIKQAADPAINQLKMQIKDASLPDNLDNQIYKQQLSVTGQQLQMEKFQMGDDPGGFQAKIDELKAQAQALKDGTQGIDDSIQSLRNQAAVLGRNATRGIDATIESLKDQLQAIQDKGTTVLDRAIEDAKLKLQGLQDGPDPTQQMRNQMLAAESQRAIAGSAGQGAIDASVKGLSDQIGAQTRAHTQALTATKQQILDLQEQQRIQKNTNDDNKTALNQQIKLLQDQRLVITQGIQDQKDAIQDRIRDLENQRTQIQRQNQTAKEGIDAQVASLEKQKQSQFDDINNRIRANQLESQRVSIQEAQAKLANDILTLPWRKELQERQDAEERAIAPLQAQLEYLNLQKSTLGLVIEQYQRLASAASAQAGELTSNKTKALPVDAPIRQPNLPLDTLDEQIAAKRKDLEEKGRSLAQSITTGMTTWLKENAGALIGEAIGFVLGSLTGIPGGGIVGAILGRQVGNEIQQTMNDFGSLGHAVKTFVEVLRGDWGPSVAIMIAQMGGMDGAAAAIALTIRDVIVPHFKTMADTISTVVIPAIGKFMEYLKDHPAIAGAAATALGVLTTGFTALRIINTITGMLAAFNAMLAANPVGIVIVAIAALAAGFVLLYNHNKTFHDFVQGTFLPALKRLGDWFGNEGLGYVRRFGDWFGTNVTPQLQRFASFVTGTVIPALGQLASWVGENILPKLQQFGNFIASTVVPALINMGTWIGDNIVPALQRFGEWIGSTAIPALTQFADWVGTHVVQALQVMSTWITENVFPVMRQFGEWFSTNILPVLQTFFSFFQDVGIPILQAAFTVVKNEVQTVVDFWIEHWTQVRDFVKDAFDIIKTTLTIALQAAKLIVQTGWNEVKTVFEATWIALEGIVDGAFKVIRGYLTFWHGIFTGDFGEAWKGIRLVFQGEWQQIQGVLEGALKLVSGTLTNTWDTIKGAVALAWDTTKGIGKVIGDAWDAIKNIFILGKDAFVDAVLGPFNAVKEKVGGIITGIKDAIATPWNLLTDGLNKFLEGFANGINGVAGKLNLGDKIHIDYTPIPKFAQGGKVNQDTLAKVGEEGWEYVRLPAGSEVYDHQKSVRMEAALKNSRPSTAGVSGGPLGLGLSPSNFLDGIGDLVGNVAGSVTDLISQGADKVLGAVLDKLPGFDGVTGMMKDLGLGAAKELKDLALDAFKEIFSGLKDHIKVQGAPVGSGDGGGGPGYETGNYILDIAQTIRGVYMYCEKFVGDVMQAAGYQYWRAPTAAAHANAQALNPGYGPPGSIEFFQWGNLGHVAFNVDGNGMVFGTLDNGRGTGFAHINLPTYGWTDHPRSGGGWVNEPVMGRGMFSGDTYSFAENRREYVSQGPEDGGAPMTFHLEQHIHPTPGMSSQQIARIAAVEARTEVESFLKKAGLSRGVRIA